MIKTRAISQQLEDSNTKRKVDQNTRWLKFKKEKKKNSAARRKQPLF